MSRFTAQQVCQIVSNEDPDDPEYLFNGSDDLGLSDDEDQHMDDDTCSDIECNDVEVEISTHDSLSPS